MSEESEPVRQYETSKTGPVLVVFRLTVMIQKATSIVPKFASFKSKPLTPLREASPSDGKGKRSKRSRNSPLADRAEVSAKSFQEPDNSLASFHSRRQHQWQPHGADTLKISGVGSILRVGQREEDRTDIFFVDTVGDPDNVVYGAIRPSSIPLYKRSGRGEVIGCQSAKIDRATSSEKGLVLSAHGYDTVDKREKINLLPAANQRLRKLKIRQNRVRTSGSEEVADYVPLRASSARGSQTEDKEAGVGAPLLSNDSKQYYHRPMAYGVDSTECLADEDLKYGTEDSASDYEDGRHNEAEEEMRTIRADLLRAVEIDPSNCDAWVELISHQDLIIGRDRNSNVTTTRAERQSNAEVKLSMYESAIKAAVTMEAKERLVLGMMEEGSKVWESSVLSSRWQDKLRSMPNSLKLWAQFLDFRQTTFLHFQYEETRASFIECLALLRSATVNSKSTGAERDDAHVIGVYIVLRLTSFMRDAGFSELSVGTWQALLEYDVWKAPANLNRELGLTDNAANLALSQFEEFWESEVPRIGEESAAGWATFTSQRGMPLQSTLQPNNSTRSRIDAINSWATLECQKSVDFRHPARTVDDVEENDPYRVILFSDVRDVLENFPALASTNKSVTVTGWLAFCHLPPWTSDGAIFEGRQWYRDPFLRTEVTSPLSRSNHSFLLGYPRLEPDQKGASGSQNADFPLDVSLVDHELHTDTLFSSKGSWFSSFETMSRESAEDHGPVELSFIRRTLSALVHAGVGGDSLAEYLLALELRLSPETVRKTARNLIKSRQESLRLYNAYACIEYRLLNETGAEKVLVGAINNSRVLQRHLQDDTIFLWRTWAWELFSSGNTKQAFERLLAYPNHQLTSDDSTQKYNVTTDLAIQPTVLLHAQQALTASREHFISHARPIHSFISCDLLILLDYLSNSASLSVALAAFNASLAALGTRFPAESPAHELLHQSFARLLYHHATHIPLFKPAVIRERLAASLTLFPHNTILLAVFSWNETRFRIDDRVRTIINDVVLRIGADDHRREGRRSVIPHFFALHNELNRSLISGSNTNSIRNTFERAVNDSAGAHCAALWESFVVFELSRGEPKKARSAWWRGIQTCPWVKALWMMGFQGLRQEMTKQELQGLYEMMTEKGLRLRVDLNELIDA